MSSRKFMPISIQSSPGNASAIKPDFAQGLFLVEHKDAFKVTS
jgi:hypothetical protein